MTFFELVFVLLYLLCGVVVGWLGLKSFGWLGGIAGFLLGSLTSLLVMRLLALIRVGGIGRAPKCGNSACRSDSYRWVGAVKGYPIRECDCGFRYIRKGRQLLEVSGDRLKPFMRRGVFGRWRLDVSRPVEESGR